MFKFYLSWISILTAASIWVNCPAIIQVPESGKIYSSIPAVVDLCVRVL